MFFPSQPAPQLASFVLSYVQIQASFDDVVLFWPIPARSFTAIEFTFGNPYRIHHVDRPLAYRTCPSIVIGAKTFNRIRLELHGCVETFAVLFRPTGLQRLFAVPGSILVNGHYEANTVFGPAIATLHSRLADASSVQDRGRIADEFLTARLPVSNAQSDVALAAEEILATHGCVRVQQLADNSGRSLRQFERRFAEHVGITPKLYARIARFEAAVQRKTTSPATSWTEDRS